MGIVDVADFWPKTGTQITAQFFEHMKSLYLYQISIDLRLCCCR
jgi:hypothetical protein